MDLYEELFSIDEPIDKRYFEEFKFVHSQLDVDDGQSTIFWKEVERRVRLRIMLIVRDLTNPDNDEKKTTMMRGSIAELFWILSIPKAFERELQLQEQEKES